MAHPKAPVNFSTPRNASKHGRFGDSLIAFLSPEAQAHLASKDNVLGTINPLTGLPEYADITAEQSAANDDWVNKMYTQVFDRESDTAGADWWSQQLDDGTYSQEDVMNSFLGSDEYTDKKMSTDYTLETAYDDILGRAPDEAGQTYYQNQYDTTDTTYDDIISSMLGSTEFDNNYTATGAVANTNTNNQTTAATNTDADGTYSNTAAAAAAAGLYSDNSIYAADTAGNDYWTGRLDEATEGDFDSIQQEFLVGLSNDNNINSTSGKNISDSSQDWLSDTSGYDFGADINQGNTGEAITLDDDGTLSLDASSSAATDLYAEHSINDGDTAGTEYWTSRFDAATSTEEVDAIEQEFLTALSNDNGIDSDSGEFLNDVSKSYLTDGSGYIDTTGDTELTETEKANIAAGLNADGTTKTLDTELTAEEQANIDAGLNADGTTKTLTDSIVTKALAEERLAAGLNPDTGAALTAAQLANIEAGRDWNVDATVVADTSGSDSEETKETVVISEEEGGTDAINLVNEALLGKSNLEEIMALLDRGNLRDLGVRYLRAIRDRNGNRIFYNLNPTEFNQNRNKLRRLYWGKTWKAVDNAEDDTGYGNRAAATSNFLGGE